MVLRREPALLLGLTAAVARGWTLGVSARPLFGETFEENWHKDLSTYRQELGLPHETEMK